MHYRVGRRLAHVNGVLGPRAWRSRTTAGLAVHPRYAPSLPASARRCLGHWFHRRHHPLIGLRYRWRNPSPSFRARSAAGDFAAIVWRQAVGGVEGGA